MIERRKPNLLEIKTDIELAEIQGENYKQLMLVQQNLIAINQELAKRKIIVNKKQNEEISK